MIVENLRMVPKESKDDYRQFYLRSDIAQSRTVIVVLAIAVIFLSISDYAILGPSWILLILEAFRISVLTYSGLVFIRINKTKSYRSYDKSLFVFLLTFIIFSLAVNVTRTQDFAIETVIASISIFAFYLAIPTRFANQATLSIVYTGGQVALMIFTGQESDITPLVMSISLVLANALAAVGSWQIHRYRWKNFQDFTERKKSERFIVIGQTAAMVGHDIRNPLQAIEGDIYLTKLDLDQLPDSEIKKDITENVTAIEQNLSYIDKIVSDLQDYTRPLNLTSQQIDLEKIINNVIHDKVPSNIIANSIVEASVGKINSDPDFIKRIFNNLVTNAVQAMPEGGKLTVSASKKESYVFLSVEDTGAGISKEAQTKLFTPLFTTKAKGQGFGLVVVKRMAEALGGTVSFESELGRGTKFTVKFPLK